MTKGLGVLLIVSIGAIGALLAAIRNRKERRGWLKEAALFSGIGLLIVGLLTVTAYTNHWTLLH